MEVSLTFEGLRKPQVPDDSADFRWGHVVSDTLLNHPRVKCQNQNPPIGPAFLGTLNRDSRGGLGLDFLYYLSGGLYWIYDWVERDWVQRTPAHEVPFFNFHVELWGCSGHSQIE